MLKIPLQLPEDKKKKVVDNKTALSQQTLVTQLLAEKSNIRNPSQPLSNNLEANTWSK